MWQSSGVRDYTTAHQVRFEQGRCNLSSSIPSKVRASLAVTTWTTHSLTHSLTQLTQHNSLTRSTHLTTSLISGPSLTNSHPPTLTCFGLHPLCGRYGISEKDGLRNCYLEAGRRCDSGEHRTAHVDRNLCMRRALSTVGPQARTDKEERT